jgi:hypothetical protein
VTVWIGSPDSVVADLDTKRAVLYICPHLSVVCA